ncbi:MAG: hypothetical protein R3B09_04065 [Nannocystaceae bacterium]
MLNLYRFTSPLVAAALAILPVQSASAAPAPTPAPATPESTPEEAPPEGEGAETAEEAPTEEAPAEEPTEEAAPEPEPEPPPPVPEGPQKPDEPVIAGKPATGKGLLIAGGTIFGVGVAVTITSVLLTNCPELSNSVGCKYHDQRNFLIPISASALTTGALLLAVGAGFKVRHNRWKRWTPESDRSAKNVKEAALVPTMIPGGAGLGYVGRF